MHLSEEFRGDLRMFAFFLGNGSLLPEQVDHGSVDYSSLFDTPSPLLGQIIAVYLHTYSSDPRNETHGLAEERAAQLLLSRFDQTYAMQIVIEDTDMTVQESDTNEVRAIIYFALALGMKELELDVLGNVDYHSELVRYGSFLEMIFAIYSNVLSNDSRNSSERDGIARRRVAHYIRNYVDSSFQVEPPFEELGN